MSGSNPGVSEAAAKAARDHAAIISAVHRLEKALASPTPGRETAWKQYAAVALTDVIDALNVHSESAENQGGVIAEAEVLLGRPPAIAAARNQHVSLLREARELLTDLEQGCDDPNLSCNAVRQRAWQLASELRHHEALEADLILEAFDLDIGGEG